MRNALMLALLILPLLALAAFFVMGLISKKGKPPGLVDGKLAACPDSPNCVSSDATDPEHFVEALSYANTKLSPEEAWKRAVEAVNSLPGTTITGDTGDYLSAECASSLFGFVDDLELQLRPDESAIAVRSASRVGRSDFGANRKRVESLRMQFEAGE